MSSGNSNTEAKYCPIARRRSRRGTLPRPAGQRQRPAGRLLIAEYEGQRIQAVTPLPCRPRDPVTPGAHRQRNRALGGPLVGLRSGRVRRGQAELLGRGLPAGPGRAVGGQVGRAGGRRTGRPISTTTASGRAASSRVMTAWAPGSRCASRTTAITERPAARPRARATSRPPALPRRDLDDAARGQPRRQAPGPMPTAMLPSGATSNTSGSVSTPGEPLTRSARRAATRPMPSPFPGTAAAPGARRAPHPSPAPTHRSRARRTARRPPGPAPCGSRAEPRRRVPPGARRPAPPPPPAARRAVRRR